MDTLTWTGTAGRVLLPALQVASIALAVALVAKLLFVLARLDGPRLPGPDGTTTARSPGDLASLAIRYSFFAALAAIFFMITVVWHVVYLMSGRGRAFVQDMMPVRRDFSFFWEKIIQHG